MDARCLDEVSEGIVGRTAGRWHRTRYGDPAPWRMRELPGELLDHVAARTGQGSAPDDIARSALLTAAECRPGEMSVGCFPDGDQEVLLPPIGEQLSTEDTALGDVVASSREQAPSARTWLDLFAACLVSHLVWDWQRVPACCCGTTRKSATGAPGKRSGASGRAGRASFTPSELG
ncbi:hypothetical protein ABZ684_30285 [Streptomyces sp. NPDC006995]|uniref:hypothetical protein n=1 Tax=Streptomyces sp. NPDC006995 TaxID=3156907 RepID=UPI0033E2FBE1